jgi:DNA primase
MDVLERKLQLLDQRGWFGDVARRRDALDRILPTLEAASEPIVRDLYLGRVVEKVGVGRDTLERELRERSTRSVRQSPATEQGTEPGVPARPVAPRRDRHPGARAELTLLRVMVASPVWRARAASEFSAADFEVEPYRAIFVALSGLPAEAEAAEAAPVVPEELAGPFGRLLESAASLAGLDLDREYEGAAERFRERAEFRRVKAVKDPEERQSIMAGWPAKTRERFAWLRARERAREPRRQ